MVMPKLSLPRPCAQRPKCKGLPRVPMPSELGAQPPLPKLPACLQLWRISDLIYRPEEEVLAELEQYRCGVGGVVLQWYCIGTVVVL